MGKYPVYDVQSFKCGSIHEDLYVNTFRDHLQNHAFVEKPHRHNSHLLLFFTKGSGIHEVDFDVYQIQPGNLFVLQPGQLHHWNLSEDIDGFVVIYSAALYNLHFGQKKITDFPFYASTNASPEIRLTADGMRSVMPYFDLLLSESLAEVASRQDKILNLLDCIHIEIAARYAATHERELHPYNAKVSQFEALLEQHFRTHKMPSFYAGKLNITLKHLNRICNEILKKTATDVIAGRILLEIKRMLTDKQLSINEIADAIGYEDYSYFSRFFKKQTGMSPTDFRTRNNSKLQ